MQSKFWSFILVVGIFVFSTILYFLFTAGDEKVSAENFPVDKQEGEVVIHLDEDGFNPEKITIKPGTYVKWLNEDVAVHTVSFTLGTSLDNLDLISQELSAGESLNYKFEHSGNFRYFDKKSKFTGTIDVK